MPFAIVMLLDSFEVFASLEAFGAWSESSLPTGRQMQMVNIHAGFRNVPQSTFGFRRRFVNGFYRVSTGFLGFYPVLTRFRHISA
jgi:hypothetical protein